MSGNGFQTSYANEKPPSTGSGDADISSDPASSGFFTTDFKRHEDLKAMLDSNKDSSKLEAMKRIIGMVAKGKDASDLFPAVVKNVVSKNLEVKKLVYVYLTRYAEEQQDLALLSISTFQRALKDPNQLIRASALRVLSSIRVTVITPIMMLAIKESVMDMSPYVRKTAAHAIPKLYSLDPETKDQLIEVLERLLGDKNHCSAIQAFEEVCPERIDLIHKNFRKLCNLLVDVEEWGQVVIINMLTRYCRTQFLNPNTAEMGEEADKPFYEDSDREEEAEEDEEEEASKEGKKKPYIMDQDHRLLLRQAKPLLNSRNAAVVMAVAQLYYHCAPKAEVGIVAKSLIRLLRSHREIQYIVLSNIATMTMKRKESDGERRGQDGDFMNAQGMFEPYLKSFYVRSSDPLHTKLLKLEILTSLATETNISTILRELQTYVTSPDKEFAAATIQAIGRCASNISEITDACLNGLVHLMSNRDESVVAESVVVIKKLLQMRPSEHKDIIVHMARMVEKIAVPMARASILWLIGEYSERVPKIAPDVLRKMAKSFVNEEDIVKLQILTLAAKLIITNPKQTRLLCQYVLNLAKYDQNYDIRDRSRFLRALVLPGDRPSALTKYAKKIFLATKPAPLLQSHFQDRDNYQLGSLSHLLNARAHGYQELPTWPELAPDPSVRNVEVPVAWTSERKPSSKKKSEPRSFYSDDSSPEDESSEESGESDSEDEEEESDDSDESEEESEEESDESETDKKKSKKAASEEDEDEEEEDSDSEEESSEEEEDSEEDSEEEEKPQPKKSGKTPKTSAPSAKSAKASSLLLDLDDMGPSSGGGSAPVTPGDLLTPVMASAGAITPTQGRSSPVAMSVPAVSVPARWFELLNKIKGNGLSIRYRFTRTISVFSPKMASLELSVFNNGENPISSIKMANKKLQPGMEIQEFPEIASLGVGSSTSVLFGINFNDTTQPATFDLMAGESGFTVSVTSPVGELLQPITLSESDFLSQQGRLSGMNDNTVSADIAEDNRTPEGVCQCVCSCSNVLPLATTTDNTWRFAGKTLGSGAVVLITVKLSDSGAKVTINTEKMVIGAMLAKDVKAALAKAQ